MQVYKGMNVGTSKVTEEERQGIPHYMLDIKEPDEPFSVAEFQDIVHSYIAHIQKKKKLPILVGGSGLYIQSVLYDYEFSERKRDPKLTEQLEKQLAVIGKERMHEKLRQIDPEQAEKIHPNNTRRLIRALEIYEATGKTMTEIHDEQKSSARYNHLVIGLEMERKDLYNQINRRVDEMMENNLLEEVRSLYERGFEYTQAMKAIGYKELIPYIKGEIDLDTAVETLKRNTRRYAKRQFTWFKNQMDVDWYTIGSNQPNPLCAIIKKIEHHLASS